MANDLSVQIYNQVNNNSIEPNWMEMFQQDPALKILFSVLNIIPGGVAISASVEAVLATYNQMGIKRQIAFFEELRKDPNKLTEGVINSEQFIHKFLITYRAIIMTNRKEKIEYFARLLKSSTIDLYGIGIDEYEECLGIIEDFSYRELQILSIIDKNFQNDPEPNENEENFNQRWDVWKKQFYPKLRNNIINTLAIRGEDLNDVLIRISRSGLYKQIQYIAGENGDGTLTPLFYKIKELII